MREAKFIQVMERALEIAETVPPKFRAIAFESALDVLLKRERQLAKARRRKRQKIEKE